MCCNWRDQFTVFNPHDDLSKIQTHGEMGASTTQSSIIWVRLPINYTPTPTSNTHWSSLLVNLSSHEVQDLHQYELLELLRRYLDGYQHLYRSFFLIYRRQTIVICFILFLTSIWSLSLFFREKRISNSITVCHSPGSRSFSRDLICFDSFQLAWSRFLHRNLL